MVGMMEEEKSTKDQFREGRRQLEEGTRKALKQSSEKIDYYRADRSELINDFSRHLGEQKEPAVSGIIVLAPLLIVMMVTGWLFDKIAQIPGNKYFNIAGYFGLENQAKFYVDQSFKLTILLIVGAIIVTGVGRFVNTEAGFEIEKILDKAFDHIPFLGTVYNVTKVSTETVLGGAEDLRQPVKIDFNGLRLTGFHTGNRAEDGRSIIFVPTAPNITSGFVVELEEENFEVTGETGEEALTRILSAGFGQSNSKKSSEDTGVNQS